MHEIQALIARSGELGETCRLWALPAPQALPHGFEIAGLPGTTIRAVAGAPDFEWPDLEALEEPELAARIEPALMALRSHPRLSAALVLTQYWGGEGYQAAVAIHEGRVILGPRLGASAVNEALRALGVRAEDDALDEWDTVGLARWRSMSHLGV